jgi:hypothetical protein
MKTFGQFLESYPGLEHRFHLGEIEKMIEDKDRKINSLVEKNSVLLKALAKIKIDLEKALKDKAKLSDTVYSAIDIARSLTPYSSDYGMTHKIDPPLSDVEKIL